MRTTTWPLPPGRAVTAVAALALGLAVVAGCTTQPVDDRDAGASSVAAGTDTRAFFADAEAHLGEQVTVSGEVSELAATTGLGGAFRITREGAEPIAVVAATPPPPLDPGDVVRVTGTVLQVQPEDFEVDFGIAAEQLFEDAAGWLRQADGQVALSANDIEVLEEQADE